MSTTVYLENPPGTVLPTRQFEPGQELRIGGHVTGAAGLGEPGQSVVLDITGNFSPITLQTNTNFWGDFWFDIVLPEVISQANIRIVVTFSFAGQDIVNIPIGIGVIPGPLPKPPPQGGEVVADILKWGAIAAGVVGVIYLASIAAPAVKKPWQQG